MPARVRICGALAGALAPGFVQRGCAVQQTSAFAAYPAGRDCDALVLAPSREQLSETAAALAHLGLNRRRPVLAVFLDAGTEEPGYGLLRRGADEVGSDAGPFVERVLARIECRERRAVLYAARPDGGSLPPVRNRLREGLEGIADSFLRRAPAPLRGARLRELVARAFSGADAPREPATRRRPEPPHATRRRPRVLVVEDDPASREALCELLAGSIDVLAAADGEAALRAIDQAAPDAVLLDLVLPGTDGFAVLAAMRQDALAGEVPVIVLSGQADEALKVRAFDAGASDFLCKPFAPRELRARIDRTLRQALERRQLREQAQTDAQTALPNYRAFKARLEEEVRRARRYATSLACVMIDLDGLKAMNDHHGHAAGSRAIVALAEVLRAELRATDFAARCGGDEFVALLPHARAHEAAVFAERVRAALALRAVEADGARLPVRASFGVAALEPGRAESPEGLLARADAALYRAKLRGRDCVALAESPGSPRSEGPHPGVGGVDPRPGVVTERRR